MNKEEIEFPKHWEIVLLGDFVHSEKGKKPKNLCERMSDECNIPYIDIKAFEKNIVDKYTDGENSRLCNEDDILIVWDGSRSGLVGKGKNGALGSTLARLNFFGINNDYAYYFMKSKYLEINSRAKGAATPHVDPELLWNYQFPLPPIEEQNRIVAKIEALFSELDNSIESLNKAKLKLALYRQSVLKSAFEGELTKAWREAHQDELEDAETLLERIKKERETAYEKSLDEWKEAVKVWEENGKDGKKPAKPRKPKELAPLREEDLKELPVLPDGWKWARIIDISHVETGATPLKKKREYYQNGTIPWVTSGALNNWTIREATDFITELALKETNVKLFPEHTLLVAMYGEGKTRGKCSELLIEATTNQAIAALIQKGYEEITRYYLKWFMQKNYSELRRLASGGAQPNLNLDIIKNTFVPLAFAQEQTQIVKEIESRFSEVEISEKSIDSELKKAEQLRQSILNDAFEGKLISRDPNDEPVSELLNRIQKEKEQYELKQKEKKNNGRRNKVTKKLSLVEVLQESKDHILNAKELWQRSKYQDNIEAFYAALKQSVEVDKTIVEMKNTDNNESYLRLANED